MDIPRFNRHQNMDSTTRERILNLITDLSITERCDTFFMTNWLYGAFDGYDYSEQMLQNKLISQLTEGGNDFLANEIQAIAQIIGSYTKQLQLCKN